MAFGYRKTLIVSAASTNGVAASQTPGGAGALTLTSAVVTLPNTGQRPQIISTADLSGRTFVLTGTEVGTGRVTTLTTIGPNNTTLILPASMATISGVTIDGAAAGALTIGWAAQADTMPLPMDLRMNPTDISFGCIVVSGSPTYTARFTMDDIYGQTFDPSMGYTNTNYNPGAGKWWDHPIVAAQTADNTGNFGKPITACGLYMSGAGTMRFQVWQGMGLAG